MSNLDFIPVEPFASFGSACNAADSSFRESISRIPAEATTRNASGSRVGLNRVGNQREEVDERINIHW